jgi:hypothetical protein
VGCCLQDALGNAAVLALLRDLDEAVRLEDAEVVVELLAGDPDPLCQCRGGCRLGQFGEQAGADGVEGHDGGCGVVDDFDVEHHGAEDRIDKKSCQEIASRVI